MYINLYYIAVFYAVGFVCFLLFLSISKKLRLFDPVNLKDSEKLIELHTKKKNTPTMGGIIFILPLIFFVKEKLHPETILILIYFVIGFVDDILKLKGKQFSIRYRLWCEFFPVFFYLLYKFRIGELNPVLRITPNSQIHLSYYVYLILTSFIFVGIVNSFNITDGVDGLVGSLVVQMIFITFLAFSKFAINFIPVNNLLNSLSGCILAFLIFNFYPAKVFMGNTGSLALGAIFANIYTLYNLHITGLIICFVMVVNTISVILQSFSYRIFGKRIFSITPLHHTLEFKGYNSIQILLIYFFANLFFNILFLYVVLL